MPDGRDISRRKLEETSQVKSSEISAPSSQQDTTAGTLPWAMTRISAKELQGFQLGPFNSQAQLEHLFGGILTTL